MAETSGVLRGVLGETLHKKVLSPGRGDRKPYEGSTVKINVICKEEEEAFKQLKDKTEVTVGDGEGDLGRNFDLCLCSMLPGERSEFTLGPESAKIEVELVALLHFDGFIFEWGVEKRYRTASKHKEKGSALYMRNDLYEAGHRYTKALKILASIPMDVERPGEVVDGVKLSDINALKEILYNNLATCYYKISNYDLARPLAEKVLALNGDNVKALFKVGMSHQNERNFEKARDTYVKLLKLQPDNRRVASQLAIVNENLRQANLRADDLMKRMVVESLKK